MSSDWRSDFALFDQNDVAFLDSAASAQKPRVVIDCLSDFYNHHYANIHRGVYRLSEQATERFEAVRDIVRDFIGAESQREIVFTRGATESVNLVAATWGEQHIKAGDEIIISQMEHHANIVPWQVLCKKTGAQLKIIRVTDEGELDQAHFKSLLTEKTKLLAITHVSNVLGTVNPIKEMAALAHAVGAKVLVDGVQAVPHMPVDVQQLDCDFYLFSAHKLYGPNAAGVLYAKQAILDAMPPYQTGGGMITRVFDDHAEYMEAPHCFEAGTPPIAEVIAMGEAINYVRAIGFDALCAHEDQLLKQATEQLQTVPGLRLIGTAPNKIAVTSFVIDGVHPHDIGTIVSEQGVAIRAGHHCAMLLVERFAIPATVRASFSLYNNSSDVERLVAALQEVVAIFG